MLHKTDLAHKEKSLIIPEFTKGKTMLESAK